MQVNPHIANALMANVQKSKHPNVVPRQDGSGMPSLVIDNLTMMTGISAFAFQGTNAHVVLARSSSTFASKVCHHFWYRRRLWYVSTPKA
jgi:acyl transferase domain-containing protein